mmetsp:Transcript_7473/g.17718  ORF Transcript_7473/g.17718 Transcript_7473/m.17718 type:complete len:128 (+) Transcript_7473:89-472(+)
MASCEEAFVGNAAPVEEADARSDVPEKYSTRCQKIRQIREQRQAFDQDSSTAASEASESQCWAGVRGAPQKPPRLRPSTQQALAKPAADPEGDSSSSFLWSIPMSLPRRVLLAFSCCTSSSRREGGV